MLLMMRNAGVQSRSRWPLQINVNLNVKCFPGMAPSVHDWPVSGADFKEPAPTS